MAKQVVAGNSVRLDKFNQFYLNRIEYLLSQDEKEGDEELIDKLCFAICFVLQCENQAKESGKSITFNTSTGRVEMSSDDQY